MSSKPIFSHFPWNNKKRNRESLALQVEARNVEPKQHRQKQKYSKFAKRNDWGPFRVSLYVD